ncbi:3-deoxy-7-phosphoheptulonate synthase [Streptomyces hypolithicus]
MPCDSASGRPRWRRRRSRRPFRTARSCTTPAGAAPGRPQPRRAESRPRAAGRLSVDRLLPPVVEAVARHGAPVVWLCDPMHGNGLKQWSNTPTPSTSSGIRFSATPGTLVAVGSVLGRLLRRSADLRCGPMTAACAPRATRPSRRSAR